MEGEIGCETKHEGIIFPLLFKDTMTGAMTNSGSIQVSPWLL